MRAPTQQPQRRGSILQTLAALCVVTVLLNACVSLQVVAERPGLTVWRVGGVSADTPPDPAMLPLSREQIRTSLSRILIQHERFTLFLLYDPEPLLPPALLEELTGVLAEQLPTLAADERIRLRFPDVRTQLTVEVDVSLEGRELVYRFNDLVKDTGFDAPRDTVNRAVLAPLAGQRVEASAIRATLWDPIDPTALAAAQNQQPLLDRITALQNRELISPEQGAALRELLQTNPGIPLPRWESYLERRETLENAKKDGLIDEAVHSARLQEYQKTLLEGG